MSISAPVAAATEPPRSDSEPPSSHSASVELERWGCERAEIPTLRAELRAAEQRRDVARERVVSVALARALMTTKTELASAVRLARRAVLLGDDGLRRDLANWHCQLGQAALAVGALTPMVEAAGPDRARLLMRTALLWARQGKADECLAALLEAAAHAPDDPLVHELQGTMHGWGATSVDARWASGAYLRAAELRQARADAKHAFENFLRAFDTDPRNPGAAEALAAQLRAQGRAASAREVTRRHWTALRQAGEGEAAHVVQQALASACLVDDVPEEAFALSLLAGDDAELDRVRVLSAAECLLHPDAASANSSGDVGFDELCVRTGMADLLCARLELVAESQEGARRSECFLTLGRLLIAHGHLDRGLQSLSEALLANPEEIRAVEALRLHAQKTGDHGPLIEALLRVVQLGATLSRRGCLETLRTLAAGRLADPCLELLCVNLLYQGAPSTELERERERLLPAVDEAHEQLEQTLLQLDAKQGEDRAPYLKRVALLLRTRPERSGQYAEILDELLEYNSDELIWRRMYERLLVRMSDRAGLARLWTRDLLALHEPNRALWAVLGLSRLERASGNLQGALAVLAADDDRGFSPAAAYQWMLAARLGQHRLRNEAIVRSVANKSPRMAAWATSAASVGLREAGEQAAALRAAEVGTRAEPGCAAPLIAFADASCGSPDRVAAVAQERAISLTFPSTKHCIGLVDSLEQLGDLESAQLWTSRWLALRPADPAATTRLLQLAAEAKNASRLGDAIAWSISQAQPILGWATPLAKALEVLATLDAEQAAQLALSALDAFGPTPAVLRDTILRLADEGGHWELQEAVLERQLAADSETHGKRSVGLLEHLVQLHARRRDASRCLPCIVRFVAAGGDPAQALETLRALPEPRSPTAGFYRLQAMAECQLALGETSDATWLALRRYGMALWDLARDRKEALRVWYRAADMFAPYGWLRMLLDLERVVGEKEAVRAARRMAESEEDSRRAGHLLSAAARLASTRERAGEAMELAMLALSTDPTSVGALSVLEECCTDHDASTVQRAYSMALAATLGSFGVRSVHYRAARFFENRGMKRRALEHAIGAFDAVPSEGVVFALLLRLGGSEGTAVEACQAVVEVARRSSRGEVRAEWLRRAALVAARCRDGEQRRMELLLEALHADPCRSTVELLERSLTDLAHSQAGGKQIGQMRFERALEELLPRLEPEVGPGVAVAMAGVALQTFHAPGLALEALGRAVALDPEDTAFGLLTDDAELLVVDDAGLAQWELAFDEVTKLGQRASDELLELALALSSEKRDPFRYMCLLVRKSERNPEDLELREQAELAVRASRRSVPPFVEALFPSAASEVDVLAQADAAAASGDAEGELDYLVQALEQAAEPSLALAIRLYELAVALEKHDVAEVALVRAVRLGLGADELVTHARPLVLQLIEEQKAVQALDLLHHLAAQTQESSEILKLSLMAARACEDLDACQAVLERLAALAEGTPKQRDWFSQAWDLAQQR